MLRPPGTASSGLFLKNTGFAQLQKSALPLPTIHLPFNPVYWGVGVVEIGKEKGRGQLGWDCEATSYGFCRRNEGKWMNWHSGTCLLQK